MSNIKKSTLQIIEAYKDAVFEKNVDAFISLYSKDVWIFDTCELTPDTLQGTIKN